jgi:hypothetical protein
MQKKRKNNKTTQNEGKRGMLSGHPDIAFPSFCTVGIPGLLNCSLSG